MFRAIVLDADGTFFDTDSTALRVADGPGHAACAAIWPRIVRDSKEERA